MCQFQPFDAPITGSGPIVIVGAGLAGLFAALKLSESNTWPIVVITPARLGQSDASSWAQGGIAAAIGAGDSVAKHIEDTIAAGSGLNDREVVRAICGAAAAHIAELDAYGVPFDRSAPNTFALSHEAAHSAKRVVRCTGDSSGRMIMKSLIAAVKKQTQITLLEGCEAIYLVKAQEQGNGQVCGVVYRQLAQQKCYKLQAKVVILACGGIGALFAATTNPPSALGQGLGLGALAGAVLADCEFVQFHPTALDVPKAPQPLISETLRGEGATLLDAKGHRFLLRDSAANGYAELAPRDVVARAVFRARSQSGAAWLDCRHLCSTSSEFSSRFPTLWRIVKLHKLNPISDLLPVIPAVHYHMGGIATDLRGRSSVAGLWAIGELGCTGFHGANRLASNSLLEAVVIANWAAQDVAQTVAANFAPSFKCISEPQELPTAANAGPFCFQALMSKFVGVERNTEGLLTALRQLAAQPQSNMQVAALSISCAALLRSQSCGSHYYQQNSAAISSSLQHLLDRYGNKSGGRCFLTWQDVCHVLAEVCR